MNDWKLALFSGLSQASGMEDIIDTAAKAVHHLGFDFCGWKTQRSHPETGPLVLTVASAEEALYRRTVSAAPTDARHSQWSGIAQEELHTHAPALLQKAAVEYAHYSWVHPAKDERTGAYSVFYADSVEPLSQARLQDVSDDMQWVAAAIHASMFHMPVRQNPPLTLREKNIIIRISKGESVETIADQLRLSLATTAFHLESAQYKLQTPDQEQAAAKALFLGLLDE